MSKAATGNLGEGEYVIEYFKCVRECECECLLFTEYHKVIKYLRLRRTRSLRSPQNRALEMPKAKTRMRDIIIIVCHCIVLYCIIMSTSRTALKSLECPLQSN